MEKTRIDAKDRKILAQLALESRKPYSAIADEVMLSSYSTAYRVNSLVKKGIILNFFPVIDFKKLGYSKYHFFILVDEQDETKKEEFYNFLIKSDYVTSIFSYSDRWDYEIEAVAKNAEEFDSFLTEIDVKFPNVIIEEDKLIVIKEYKNTLLPRAFFYQELLNKTDSKIKSRTEELKIDSKDMQILKVLSQDARLSSYEMKPLVGLDSDTIIYRIRRLVKSGVIKNFSIRANLNLLGYNVFTFLIRVRKFDFKDEAKFRRISEDNKHLLYSAKTLGDYDMLLRIASNPEDLHALIVYLKKEFSQIMKIYESLIMSEQCFFNPLPNIILKNFNKTLELSKNKKALNNF